MTDDQNIVKNKAWTSFLDVPVNGFWPDNPVMMTRERCLQRTIVAFKAFKMVTKGQ